MRKLEASILILLLLFLVFGSLAGADPELDDKSVCVYVQARPVLASQIPAGESMDRTTGYEAEATEKAGGAEKEDQGHQRLPPFMYFVQWLILIVVFVLGLWYYAKVKSEGKPHHEGLGLAYVLTTMVFLFFALNYYPSIVKYKEPNLASFLKFLLLLLNGVLVTFYGVLGRHEEP